MFTKEDIHSISPAYFKVIEISSEQIIIKSKCTGHTWCLEFSDDGYVIILHKHHDKDKFHFHFACISLEEALEEITGHDEFQLNHRRATFVVHTREGAFYHGRKVGA